MRMLDQFRGAAGASWPISWTSSLAVSLLVVGTLVGTAGCVQTPRGNPVITEPAPPLLEGKAQAPKAAVALGADGDPADWRDPRDDSESVEGTGSQGIGSQGAGSQGVAAAAREAAAAAAVAGGAAPTQRRSSSPADNALIAEAHSVLDDWHQAAAVGDRDRYIDHFTMDGVFMGTDAAERWDLATFTSYVDKHFTSGVGWVYQPFNRHVTMGEGSKLAWFDEELDSAGYGALRGTGVLRRDGDSWKITHYSMVFTIPNGVAPAVVDVVRSSFSASGN